MTKLLHFGQTARDSLIRGATTLARAVGVTLGPKGRTVILKQNWAGISVVADGFTIAREFNLPDPFEDMAVMLIKDAAEKVYEQCGDGTTTTILLASAIVDEANKNVAAGTDPVQLIKGIRRASKVICSEIEAAARPVESQEEVLRIATLAAQDQSLGPLIAEALEHAGEAGVIIVEDSEDSISTVDLVEGIQFDGGFISAGFVSDVKRQESIIEKPHLLITDAKLAKVDDILPALEKIIPISTNIVIICDSVEGEALAGLLMNRERGHLDVLAVKAPGLGGRGREMLTDIAIATGGSLLPDEQLGKSLLNVTEEDLGRAEQVIATSANTTISGVSGDPTKLENRIQHIKSLIADAQTAQYRRQLKRRLGTLHGRMAIVKVGAITELERKEIKHRIENGVSSAQTAVEGGIVPGAGIGLLDALSAVETLDASDDEATGIRVMKKAAQLPVRLIASNAGEDSSLVVDRIMREPNGYGFNADTGLYGDMQEMGIIEPADLVKSIVQKATSIATSIVSVEAVIVNTPEEGPAGERPDLSARYE